MQKSVLVVGLLLATAIAHAGTYTISFLGFQQGGWQEGYPYFASINGGPVINVMCDDYAHGGAPGESWKANFTDLGNQNLTLLRFNQLPGALTLYDETGWLLLETLVTNKNQWTDMNSAVWYIFDNKVQLDQGAQTWLHLAEQEAKNGFYGIDFHKVGIYTPLDQYDSNPNGPQEMMTITADVESPSPIPEPSALSVLLGGGLMGWVGRKLLL
jgi:hypothetical protein